ncbi:hypothetical protein MXD63_01535 [Frankia sp. Cpl3]|uniref:hypothetical protein n=1 Tax=Parafrankia colletiae TaxID=573497 RepID=UPI001041FCD6|nr:hypothetical protein [Parafrankia colletiae]MCK9898765.1 hypothetical protein [Frankia sp. Cpl3]
MPFSACLAPLVLFIRLARRARAGCRFRRARVGSPWRRGPGRGLAAEPRGDERRDLLRCLPQPLGGDGQHQPAGGAGLVRPRLADAHEQPPGSVPDVQSTGRRVGGVRRQCPARGQGEGELDLPVQPGEHPRGPPGRVVERVADQRAAGDRAPPGHRPPHRVDGDEALPQRVDDQGAGLLTLPGPLGHVDHGTRRDGAWRQPRAVDVRRGQPGGAAEGDPGHRRAPALRRDQHGHDVVVVAGQAVEGGGRGAAEDRAPAAGEQGRPGLL